MRLASFTLEGRTSFGVVKDNGIVDLGRRLAPRFRSLLEVLHAQALHEIAAASDGVRPDYPLTQIELLPPVLGPDKIICVGINYANRNAEYRDNSDASQYPSLFMRTPGSFAGHDRPILRPAVSHQFDYEGELVLVIGSEGRYVPAERWLDYVAGITLCNEGSVRDWMRHGKHNVTQGKNFDNSGSIGPWMVTADEIDWRRPLHLTTRVNDQVRQDDTTANMLFSFGSLIAYISTFTTLKPGDMIATGTPTGAGARFEPPLWLVPGDVVEIETPEIGILRNVVADE